MVHMYARSSVSYGYDQTFSNVGIDRTCQRGDLVTDNMRGRPRTARTPALVQTVENKINKECRQMLWDVASSVGVSCVTVHTILKHDFYMNKVSLHMLPLILMEEQKETCIRICINLLKADAADDIFWEWSQAMRVGCKNTIWSKNNQPRPGCVPMNCYSKKCATANRKSRLWWRVFFNWRGMLLIEWTPKGTSVIKLFPQYFSINIGRI